MTIIRLTAAVAAAAVAVAVVLLGIVSEAGTTQPGEGIPLSRAWWNAYTSPYSKCEACRVMIHAAFLQTDLAARAQLRHGVDVGNLDVNSTAVVLGLCEKEVMRRFPEHMWTACQHILTDGQVNAELALALEGFFSAESLVIGSAIFKQTRHVCGNITSHCPERHNRLEVSHSASRCQQCRVVAGDVHHLLLHQLTQDERGDEVSGDIIAADRVEGVLENVCNLVSARHGLNSKLEDFCVDAIDDWEDDIVAAARVPVPLRHESLLALCEGLCDGESAAEL